MKHKHKYILDKNNFGICECGASKQFPREKTQKLRPCEVKAIENLSPDFKYIPDSWCGASVHGVKLDNKN